MGVTSFVNPRINSPSMTQLKLVYSSNDLQQRMPRSGPSSKKLRMSRVTLLRSPRVASKFALLEAMNPHAAAVIERLVDDALRRKTG